ncbi:efflux RND transporter periplasmic adaptor subunit [Methylotetracoccus oryzae]|uniref:efflux RND transporter periplasmic adaptor subunit n=1 Tax=Methylotetracoccus oryzae TaxID=1919059 RepID=UPI00111B05C1|nr:efflux RND transporter periplasmic adaptor subunit [Methylotetracoccus oryzae]
MLRKLGLCVPLLLAACDQTADKPPPQPAPPAVEVVAATQRDVPIYREWVGTLDGMVNAEIRAQVTGYLVKQNYREGDLVRKGQLLYEIDPRTFQAAVDAAKSSLAREEAELITARLELERIRRLLPQNAVSVRDRDAAVGRESTAAADVLTAKASLQKAQLDLAFTRIVSPIDGIAGISKAQLGNLVGPGTGDAVLTTVSKVNPIRVYISISEQEYLAFNRANPSGSDGRGTGMELILADNSLHSERGQVYFADRQVDSRTGAILLATLFPNPGNLLRPGQFARVRAMTRIQPAAVLVPQRAVTELQGMAQLAVVKPDNTVEFRKVRTGERVGSQWVIDQGLRSGERVIVEGIQKVRPGMPVQPQPYQAPPETPPPVSGASRPG